MECQAYSYVRYSESPLWASLLFLKGAITMTKKKFGRLAEANRVYLGFKKNHNPVNLPPFLPRFIRKVVIFIGIKFGIFTFVVIQ